ncbi:hypothetical protein [Amycolatopsis sp. NPDC051128]|uniref:hypothetical protein n=1 Tax=Amycolatopsis sp. NPDC051128 TaxID=3155412 RepID=UPI003432F6BA
MTSQLSLHGRSVVVDSERIVEAFPRFIADEKMVVIGPLPGRGEHESHVLNTVGSVDWFSSVSVDEFRFDNRSGVLVSAALHVPDQVWEPARKSELGGRSMSGAICLVDIADFFSPSTTVRHYGSDDVLTCLMGSGSAADQELTFLDISQGLSLIFAVDQYVGWRLVDASAALADSSGEVAVGEAVCVELREGLADYLELTSTSMVEQLYGRDRIVRNCLERLVERLSDPAALLPTKCTILSRMADDLLREWFD